MKRKTMIKKANVDYDQNQNSSTLSNNIEDFSQIITVRVSLKTGIHKFDQNEVSRKRLMVRFVQVKYLSRGIFQERVISNDLRESGCHREERREQHCAHRQRPYHQVQRHARRDPAQVL